MGILIALLVVAAVAVLVSRLRPGAREASGEPPRVEGAPAGWVLLRGAIPATEAQVIQSLLVSNGIRAAVDPLSPTGRALRGYGAPADRCRVYVAPEDAETAEELLS